MKPCSKLPMDSFSVDPAGPSYPRVFLWTDSDQFAGTERHLVDLERGLRRCAVPVVVVCPPGTPLEESVLRNGGRVRALDCRGHHGPEAVWRMRRWIQHGELDILHAHNGKTALMGSLARFGSESVALVVSQHFIHPARSQRAPWIRRASRPIYQWLESQVDTWVCVSEAVRRAMGDRGEGTCGRVVTVRNGLGEEGTVKEFKAVLGLDPARFHLVCVARLAPEKGHSVLLEAIAQMRPENRARLHLHLIGEGPLRAALEQQSQNLGLNSSVFFLGFQANPSSWMQAADAVVLASPEEPFGLVLLEAMRASRAVIAARAGGPVEIVGDQESGLLFEPGNSMDLAQKLDCVVEDRGLCRRLGLGGYRRWRQEFSLESMSVRMASVYRGLARLRPKALS